MLKFLLLILAIAAVWYGYRYVNRKRPDNKQAGAPPAQPQVRTTAPPAAEDLKPCPVCGAYTVAAPGQSCGRPDCRPPEV